MATAAVPSTGAPAREPDPAAVDTAALGIEPVPEPLRTLRATDVAVLWGDLAVGILVLAAGALLVAPADVGGLGLGLGTALGAIAVGSVVGSLLLAFVAAAGHERAVPTMVLLRPVLGRVGSYGASAVNVAQLVGWTAFEFWAMALFANRVSDEVFGFDAFGVWLAVVAVLCTAMAVAGPIRVIRAWLARFGVWIVLATCGYLTVYLLTRPGLGDLFDGTPGGAPFGAAVDLVVAMPVSWLPLVADYNRFARDRAQSFAGTFAGYALGNAWFYALGALLVLAGGVADSSPEGLAAGILGLSAGTVVGAVLLAGLLAGETDEAFADIYSVAVSAQNVFPRLPQRVVVVVVGAVAAAIAAVVTATDYEAFLFLLGSVFVPLFAVLLAAAATGALRRTSDHEPAFRPAMVATWFVGFAVYHWMVPADAFLPGWWLDVLAEVPGAGEHTSLGASLPSFVVTFVLALAVSALGRRRSAAPA